MKRRVAIYVRVSGEEQVKGYSIGEQKDRLKTYCKLKDWIVVKTYEDPAFSGGTMDRPGLQSMLSACRKGTGNESAYLRMSEFFIYDKSEKPNYNNIILILRAISKILFYPFT